MDKLSQPQQQLHEPHDDMIHGPPSPTPDPGPKRSRIGILRPLRIKDFALLWSGMTISLIGDGIYLVAVAFQVYALSDSPGALSLVFFAWTAPMVLVFLVAGVMTDRVDRRWMMIGADVIRGVSLGILGVMSIAGDLTLGWMYVLVAIYGVGDALFMPAFTAIVPDIVPDDLLLEANSLDSFVRPLTMRMVGPAVGGLLVATLGPGQAIVVDAVSFGASALCIALIRPRRVAHQDDRPKTFEQIAEGFRFVRAHTWLWATLASAAVSLLAFFGPLEVLVPYVVKHQMGGDASDYGLILAMGGIGAAIVSAGMGQTGMPRRHMTFMYVAWTVGLSLVSAFAFAEAVWQAMVISAFLSAAFTAGMIVWGTLMHKLVPAELLGRVSSLDWLISTSLLPVSFLITGPIAGVIGVKATLIGGPLIAGVLTLGFLLVPGIHDTERDGSVHGPDGVEPERPAVREAELI